MRYCLRLMRSMVSVGDDGLNQDLVDQGAINQIIGRYCDFLSGGRRGDWGDKRNFIVFLGYILHYHSTSPPRRINLFGKLKELLLGDLWRTSIPFSKGRSLSHGLITSVHKTYCVIHRKETYPVDNVIHPLNNRGSEVEYVFFTHISWEVFYPWDSKLSVDGDLSVG